MMLGIMGAMQQEIRLLLERCEEYTVQSIAGMAFYSGMLAGQPVTLVASNGGKVNAAACAQILIDRFNVHSLVFTGVAGALHPSLTPGDLVISTSLVQHDVDVTAFGYELGSIPDLHIRDFEADALLREAATHAAASACPDVPVREGVIATGDAFIHSAEQRERLSRKFDALCVDMESAAVAHVAYLNAVPFVAVRAISDSADGYAPGTYEDFLTHAAETAAALVCELANHLPASNADD